MTLDNEIPSAIIQERGMWLLAAGDRIGWAQFFLNSLAIIATAQCVSGNFPAICSLRRDRLRRLSSTATGSA